MTDPNDDDDDLPSRIEWSLHLYGGDRIVLQQVAFGLPGTTRILIEAGLTDDEQGAVFGLTVGGGPTFADPAEGLEEIAQVLEGFVDALRDAIPELVAAGQAND